MQTSREFLTEEQIKKQAPAVYGEAPASDVSQFYTFVPTYEIVDMFGDLGWKPVEVKQVYSSTYPMSVQEHSVRLAPVDGNRIIEVGDCEPEIYLRNSHNRRCRFELALAFYRKVCSNGLIVADSMFESYNLWHIGMDFHTLKEALKEAGEKFMVISDQIKTYKTIELSYAEKMNFAKEAVTLTWGPESKIEPDQLLVTHRKEDESPDLFSIYNVIQENILKGGVPYVTNPETGTISHTSAVASVKRDHKINTELWMLMAAFGNR